MMNAWRYSENIVSIVAAKIHAVNVGMVNREANMNKELQEAIKVGKLVISKNSGIELTPKGKEALSALISAAEELEDYKLAAKVEAELGDKVRAQLQAIKSASSELPKKIERLAPTHLQYDLEDDNYQAYYNQLIDDFAPIHQKQVLRIKELEKGILKSPYQVIVPMSFYEQCEKTDKLKAELTRLKQKEELDVGKVVLLLDDYQQELWEKFNGRKDVINYEWRSPELWNKYATAIVSRFSLGGVNKELLGALKKLACLGNGDVYGNSDGNIIAQEAISKIEEAGR